MLRVYNTCSRGGGMLVFWFSPLFSVSCVNPWLDALIFLITWTTVSKGHVEWATASCNLTAVKIDLTGGTHVQWWIICCSLSLNGNFYFGQSHVPMTSSSHKLSYVTIVFRRVSLTYVDISWSPKAVSILGRGWFSGSSPHRFLSSIFQSLCSLPRSSKVSNRNMPQTRIIHTNPMAMACGAPSGYRTLFWISRKGAGFSAQPSHLKYAIQRP